MPPPLDPGQRVRRVVGTLDRPPQLREIELLARDYHKPRLAVFVFTMLTAARPNGPRLAAEVAARTPRPIPEAILALAVPLLELKTIPVSQRLSAAAKLMSAGPESPDVVGPIVRGVTAGLSRSRTLERLIDLQHRVPESAVLDQLVVEHEARVKLRCPKCRAKLTRPAFIKHLWRKHRLLFENGKAREASGA